MKHYKGAQLFTVRNLHGSPESLDQVLGQIAAIGYDAVHGWLMYDSMDYAMYKDMLQKHGLRDCTVSGGDSAAIAHGCVDAIVRNARLMEVESVDIDPIPLNLKYTEEGFRFFARQMNEAGRKLYDAAGLSISYHSHAQEFASFGGVHGMDIFFEETDPRYVHFTLDTHWIVSGGCDPARWIRKAGQRARIVHLKDYRIVPGANQNVVENVVKDFAEVGQGNIEWTEVIAACREVGTEYFIVEQDQCPGHPLDSLKVSFNKMIELGL